MNEFRFAPPPKTVDGLYSVPVRVDSVTASFTIDAATKTASASAELAFTVGSDSGFPVFDLRQAIESATLDGAAVAAGEIAHHDFGGGDNAEMRILERWLEADTAHVLALDYPLGTPSSPNARGLVWEANTGRLSFDFFFSDLNPARYLESWLPSSMLWGSFPVTLEVQMTGAPAHVLISNGAVSELGVNHWSVSFPAHYAPCSHFLLIEAADRIAQHAADTILPGGQPVTVDVATRLTDGIDLVAGAAAIAGHLSANTSAIGSYRHGDRYVALLTNAGYHNMEYDGATTTSTSALGHEVYHSWWARGLVPAHGQDGWLDEAWTSYNTAPGGPDAVPLDMADAAQTLWPGNPWARSTPLASYGDGASVFSGIAADIGIGALKGHMASIYQAAEARHVSTPEIEAELIRRSGHMLIADYFERFVYGGDTAGQGAANLHLRDASGDTGAEPYSGTFWLSPDVWVRQAEDGGTTPQDPEFGQDNWLYARVRNRGTATARSFVVGFKLQVWAGTEFVYPGDWFPLTGVAVDFDLAPGESRIVRTRWPAADIPPEGTHGCLLALAWCLDDRPVAGRHVWEEDTLAQRNLTIVNLHPDEWEHLPIRIGSRYRREAALHRLELIRPREAHNLEVHLTHRDPARAEALFRSAERLKAAEPLAQSLALKTVRDPGRILLGRGRAALAPAAGSILAFAKPTALWAGTGEGGARLVKERDGGLAIAFDPGPRAVLPIGLRLGESLGFRLCVRAPGGVPRGARLHLVQRDEAGRAVGGLSLALGHRDQKEEYR